jgi:hypothetical protein
VAALSAPAWADPPALQVSTDAAGNVTVNGVVFEASLGLSADDIRSLVEVSKTSLDQLIHQPQAVQDRVNRVLQIVCQEAQP